MTCLKPPGPREPLLPCPSLTTTHTPSETPFSSLPKRPFLLRLPWLCLTVPGPTLLHLGNLFWGIGAGPTESHPARWVVGRQLTTLPHELQSNVGTGQEESYIICFLCRLPIILSCKIQHLCTLLSKATFGWQTIFALSEEVTNFLRNHYFKKILQFSKVCNTGAARTGDLTRRWVAGEVSSIPLCHKARLEHDCAG